jgi:hypothetical protein
MLLRGPWDNASAASRLLPTPGSPDITTHRNWPDDETLRTASNCDCCSPRPTSFVLRSIPLVLGWYRPEISLGETIGGSPLLSKAGRSPGWTELMMRTGRLP